MNMIEILNDQCNEEGSTSSTITVYDRKQLQTDQLSQRATVKNNTKSTKRVDFNLSANTVHCNSYNDQDVSRAWYSRMDYHSFREHNEAMIKEIAEVERKNRFPFSYTRIVTRTYRACNDCAEDMSNKSFPVLDETEMSRLKRWLNVSTSRLGLEKWAIKGYRNERQYKVYELVESVLDLQDMESDELQYVDDVDELIRIACERLTRPSKMFARIVAEAHAASFLEESNEEVVGGHVAKYLSKLRSS